MHCDLSVNNVLLNRKDGDSQAIGLLIDYDYSLIADSGSDSESANHQNPRHTQAASSAASVSGTYIAEDTSIGEKVVVTNAEVPLDTSEGSMAEKAHINRTVRYGRLLNRQVIMILRAGYTTIYGY